jgi:NAD(P)-dependent dehydrogenase (short-subunit alcohol dehydrogenase family)
VSHHTDVSDEDSAESAMKAAVDAFGGINILVSNAAAFVFGEIEDVTRDDWNRAFGVNVIGHANCVRAALPALRESAGGAIVNMASASRFSIRIGVNTMRSMKSLLEPLYARFMNVMGD